MEIKNNAEAKMIPLSSPNPELTTSPAVFGITYMRQKKPNAGGTARIIAHKKSPYLKSFIMPKDILWLYDQACFNQFYLFSFMIVTFQYLLY